MKSAVYSIKPFRFHPVINTLCLSGLVSALLGSAACKARRVPESAVQQAPPEAEEAITASPLPFASWTGVFRKDNAHFLALAARRAYEAQTQGSSRTGTEWLLIEEQDYAVLAFRGTEPNLADILTDSAIGLRPWHLFPASEGRGPIHVHTGFLTAFLDIETQVRDRLEALYSRKPRPPLFLTGHSMGGALALVATLWIERWFPKWRRATYVYGTPRVIGRTSVADLSDLEPSIHQVVFENDPVPDLPPPLAFGTFGTYVSLMASNCQPRPGRRNMIVRTLDPIRLRDHDLTNYISCLSQDP